MCGSGGDQDQEAEEALDQVPAERTGDFPFHIFDSCDVLVCICSDTQELKDIRSECAQEKEDLLDSIREADRQLKLKNLILQNFVPLDEVSE